MNNGGIMEFFSTYKYIIVPLIVWFIIQNYKWISELIITGKLNFKRIIGAGGMPSSHSALVSTLTTMIGKYEGITTPIFAVSLVFSLIVMYDASGVRRAAGKQAKMLNKIVETPGLTNVEVGEKLVEVLGHTPIEVIVGVIVGVLAGLFIG